MEKCPDSLVAVSDVAEHTDESREGPSTISISGCAVRPPEPKLPKLEPLCRCSYVQTLWAGLILAGVLTLGCVLLGLSEQGVFGVKEGQLASRFASCVLLFYYPFIVGLLEVRCLAMGLQPKEGFRAIWRLTFSPCRYRQAAHERGTAEGRAALVPVIFHVTSLVALFCTVCLPLHPDGHPVGLVFTYMGTIVTGLFVNSVVQRKLLPFLDLDYCLKSGAMLAISLPGFIIITVFCCSIRPYLGSAFGLVMPTLATLMEYWGTAAIGHIYDRYFVRRPEVQLKFAATQQSMYPSCCIALLSASAHSARLTVLLSEALQDPDSDSWMVSLVMMLVLALPVRLGYMHKFWQFVSFGRLHTSIYKLLLLKSQYQMGYPRFLAAAAVGLARMATGKPLLPSPAVGWVALLALVEEVAEDVMVALCESLGLMAKWDCEAESTLSQIVPGSDGVATRSAWEPDNAAAHAARKRLFTSSLDQQLPLLPFWAHFSACSISMYHTILFIFLMGGGTSVALGICPQESAVGTGRGILVWPTGVDACIGA